MAVADVAPGAPGTSAWANSVAHDLNTNTTGLAGVADAIAAAGVGAVSAAALAAMSEFTTRYAPIGTGWQAWTPGATATGGGLGFGTTGKIQLGRYEQNVKTVRGWLTITLGAGASGGSGFWQFALPVAPSTANLRTIGSGFIMDLSGTDVRVASSLVMAAGDATAQIRPHGSTSNVAHNVPWTWAAGDQLEFQFSYEAA